METAFLQGSLHRSAHFENRRTMSRNRPSASHHIYLLTVWREAKGSETDHGYRFRLEDPHSGEGFGFTTLLDLLKILEQMNQNEEIKSGSRKKSSK